MSTPDVLVATHALVEAFDRLGIRYFIGGSLASSVHGLPRSTLDVDLVADLRPEHVQPLAERLQGAFYVDEDMVRDAVARRSSFNVIHLDTMVKLDVFVLRSTSYDRGAFSRAQEETLVLDQESRPLRFATPEDVVLHKLYWYASGGQASERQWDDVLGVLRVQGSALELEYLRRWAAELEISSLLEGALVAAGLAPGS